jgi:hypothetical protein
MIQSDKLVASLNNPQTKYISWITKNDNVGWIWIKLRRNKIYFNFYLKLWKIKSLSRLTIRSNDDYDGGDDNDNKIIIFSCPRHKEKEGKHRPVIDSCILNHRTRWRWTVNFTLQPLYPPGKKPRRPVNRRLSGTRSRLGRFGGQKNPLILLEFKPWLVQPVV